MKTITFSDEIYKKNVSVFLQKYPKYTFFTPAKALDSFCFAKGVEIKNSEDLQVLYVYGLGLAFHYLYLKKKAQNLVFIEDDPDIFFSFLKTSLATQILQDDSCHIFLKLDFESEERFIDSIVKKFPFGNIEIIVSENQTEKKKRYFQDVLKMKILKSATYFAASHKEDLYSYLNFKNFIGNLDKLPGSFHVNLLKDKFKGVPAIICGAGPSLYKNKEFFKKIKDKALIIAGGSAITALTSYGIKPHMGVIVDPNEEEVLRIKNAKMSDIPIIYSLRVHRDVFKYLNGPLGYMSSIAGGLESFLLEKDLKIKAQEVMGEGFSRDAFSVTTLNVSLARFLGCNPIVLLGVDLAYEDNKRYSPGVVVSQENNIADSLDDPGDFLIRKENNLTTSVKWTMESQAISDYKNKYDLNIVNASGGLGFTGIENVSLNELESSSSFLSESFMKEYSKTFLKVSENDIDLWKKNLKKSFEKAKTFIFEMKDEMKKAELENRKPFLVVSRKELEEEISFKYFLNRPKRALETLFAKDEVKVLEKLHEIANFYLKSFE